MPAISIIQRSKLEGLTRVDAEYYHPRYLKLASTLKRQPCKTLKRLNASLDCSAFYPSVAPYYARAGVPFLRIDDIKNGFVRMTGESVYLPEQILEENTNTIRRCAPGDIVIAKGGNTIAKVGILTDAYCHYAACRDLIVLRTTGLATVERFYLLAYLLSTYGQELMIRTASQTGQPHLTIGSIKQLAIPLFDDDFHSTIERLMKNAEILFSKAQAQFARSEAYLTTELNLGNLTRTQQLTYTKPYSAVIAEARCDAEHFHPMYSHLRTKIQEYPNGFCKLTDIVTNSQETVEPRLKPDEDFRYVELASVDHLTGTIDHASRVRGKVAPSRARMLLRAGDVLVSSVEGSLEKVALVSNEFDATVGSTGFFVLRPKEVESEFVLALVRSPIVREQLRCAASGTILSAVAPKALQKIQIPRLRSEKREEVTRLVKRSHEAHHEAKTLLDAAKRAIQIAIEKGQKMAMDFLVN